MKNIPSRDISGICKGECKNLVREGEEKRQDDIDAYMRNEKASATSSWTKS